MLCTIVSAYEAQWRVIWPWLRFVESNLDTSSYICRNDFDLIKREYLVDQDMRHICRGNVVFPDGMGIYFEFMFDDDQIIMLHPISSTTSRPCTGYPLQPLDKQSKLHFGRSVNTLFQAVTKAEDKCKLAYQVCHEGTGNRDLANMVYRKVRRMEHARLCQERIL